MFTLTQGFVVAVLVLVGFLVGFSLRPDAASPQVIPPAISASANVDGLDELLGGSELVSSRRCHFLRAGESITQCPDEELYVALWALRRPKRKWTIVDVGSNKGYSVSGMLDALNFSVFDREHLGLDIFAYGEKHNTPIPGARFFLCGSCCECGAESVWVSLRDHPWYTQRKSDVQIAGADVWMFDGTKSHVDYNKHFFSQQLRKLRDTNSNAPTIQFHFEHRAVAAETGTAVFEQAPLGVEMSSLGKSQGGEKVPVIALDSFLPSEVQEIDVLLTDTEGFDFDVYDGAKRFLKAGKVGIYVFELHRGPNRKKVGTIVRELEEAGFVCYYPVQGKNICRHVVRISHECWDDSYNANRGWINMVCANERRFPELTDVFVELEHRPKDATWFACKLPQVKRMFFDKHPQNWSWAMQPGKPKRGRRRPAPAPQIVEAATLAPETESASPTDKAV